MRRLQKNARYSPPNSTHIPFDLCPSPSTERTSPSRKLQQVFEEELLKEVAGQQQLNSGNPSPQADVLVDSEVEVENVVVGIVSSTHPTSSVPQLGRVSSGMFDPIQEEGSDSEEVLMEVLQGVVSSTLEVDSLIQQPRPAVTSAGPVTVPDPANVPVTATSDQAVYDNFSGVVARSAPDHLTPKPPDIQHIKSKEMVAELAVNNLLFYSVPQSVLVLSVTVLTISLQLSCFWVAAALHPCISKSDGYPRSGRLYCYVLNCFDSAVCFESFRSAFVPVMCGSCAECSRPSLQIASLSSSSKMPSSSCSGSSNTAAAVAATQQPNGSSKTMKQPKSLELDDSRKQDTCTLALIVYSRTVCPQSVICPSHMLKLDRLCLVGPVDRAVDWPTTLERPRSGQTRDQAAAAAGGGD
ncbi:hypothetical protein RHGRI_026534 [Rhododendron griersonianum]|uniref:Uncharacterized protein n=1 Tax=Rhododendron griersonianum TaxID=479676 RepID=A0AAV6ITD5_9ERIC|nr:hypothetical protein RHGRI_026534 [Rhododendron griersonianum]